MYASCEYFPYSFGEQLCDIRKHCHHYKAAEWVNWTHILSPIYLKPYLRIDIYKAYIALVEAIGIACNYTHTIAERQLVHTNIIKFLTLYEKEFYQYKYKCLSPMRSVFHILAHISQCMQWNGPMRNYWQFPMERVVGIISSKVKSRVLANEGCANVILRRQWLHSLFYTLSPNKTPNEDATLSNFCMRILHSRRLRVQLTLAAPPLQPGLPQLLNRFSKPTKLDPKWRSALALFIHTNEIPLANNSLPSSVITCKRLRLNDGSSIRSRAAETSVASHITRLSACIRYKLKYSTEDCSDIQTSYGMIEHFFVLVDSGGNYTHQLAYVTNYSVLDNGRLLYCARTGKTEVISVHAIEETIGIVMANKQQFLVTKESSLLC